MSADSEAVVQVNRPDDYSAQPPLKDVVSGPETPLLKDVAGPETPLLKDVAGPETPLLKDVIAGPETSPDETAGVYDGVDAASPPTDRHVASPVDQKYCVDSITTPPPSGGDEPMDDVPYTADCEIEEGLIKDEIVDLGNDPYFYDDKQFQLNIKPLKVGFDRGLEPDHIVGATEQNGKLMFLIAWKNSIDGVTDLLEANEIYEKCPQIAIKFFEDRLIYFPPDASDKI